MTRSGWQHDAACVGTDTEAFFPSGKWGTPSDAQEVYAKAARICDGCPVRVDCLETALAEEGDMARSNRYGMRGGTTPGQRRSIYDARRRTQLATRITGAAS